MKQCLKCNVKILDDTDRCPLCRHALTGDEPGVNSYPNAIRSIKRARFFENLFLFLSLVVSISLMVINYMTKHRVSWSLIVVLVLFYVNAIIRYAILGKSGYLAKIIGMFLIAIAVLLGIDYWTGFNGWSLTFVYPSAIMAADLSVLILMLVNRRNWQSYIMSQIFFFLLSLLSIVFVLVGINKSPLVALIASVVALFVLMGTIILGDQRARDELKRRFHI